MTNNDPFLFPDIPDPYTEIRGERNAWRDLSVALMSWSQYPSNSSRNHLLNKTQTAKQNAPGIDHWFDDFTDWLNNQPDEGHNERNHQ